MFRKLFGREVRILWIWAGAVTMGAGLNMIVGGPGGFVICATFAVAIAAFVFRWAENTLEATKQRDSTDAAE